MNYKLFVAGLLSLALVTPALVTPAAAQSAPDDLHCFLLSNVFAKSEKDEKRRMLAVQTTMFFLGKIDGRINPGALAAVMASRLDPKTAGPEMNACAQRFVHAEQSLQATIKSVAPKH